MWLLAECTVHVEMSGERIGGCGGGGVGVGGGSVRCSEVGTELRRGESAATAAGRTVKICLLFVMELGYSWLT